jgi:hypothetical protein
MTLNLRTVEAKAFVPARDFALSKRFYLALGFEIPWSLDNLVYVRHGDSSFLLQFFLFKSTQKIFKCTCWLSALTIGGNT